jgi:hypothetical protein
VILRVSREGMKRYTPFCLADKPDVVVEVTAPSPLLVKQRLLETDDMEGAGARAFPNPLGCKVGGESFCRILIVPGRAAVRCRNGRRCLLLLLLLLPLSASNFKPTSAAAAAASPCFSFRFHHTSTLV